MSNSTTQQAPNIEEPGRAALRADWIVMIIVGVGVTLIGIAFYSLRLLTRAPMESVDQWLTRGFVVLCLVGCPTIIGNLIHVMRKSTTGSRNTLARYNRHWAMNATDDGIELYEVGLADQTQQSHFFPSSGGGKSPAHSGGQRVLQQYPVPKARIRVYGPNGGEDSN